MRVPVFGALHCRCAIVRARRTGSSRYPGRERGFSYLMVLLLVALLGTGLATAGLVWRQVAVREREAELLFVGDQFRQAFLSYGRQTPVGQPKLPRTLDELVADNRQPKVARHLRRIYPDPITGRADWGLVLEAGRIKGVYSRGPGTPVKTAEFPPAYSGFAKATSYAQWRFTGGDGVTPANPATPPGVVAGRVAAPGNAVAPVTAGAAEAPPPPLPPRSPCEAMLDQGMDNCARAPDYQKALECQEPVLNAWSRCENEARSRL